MPSIINATTTAGVAVTGDNSGALALQTNNGTTAVTIDTSQNVGIGTTSPTAKLDVNGTAKATTVQATTLSDGTNSTSSTNVIRGSAKAWVNFGGGILFTAGAINGSYNVSSITVNATGDYTVNYTSALPNANYCALLGASTQANSVDGRQSAIAIIYNNLTTTTARLTCYNTVNGTGNNSVYMMYAAIST